MSAVKHKISTNGIQSEFDVLRIEKVALPPPPGADAIIGEATRQ